MWVYEAEKQISKQNGTTFPTIPKKLPYGNTGAQSTDIEQIDIYELLNSQHNGMYVSIDWLEFTIKSDDPWYVIINVLCVDSSDFTPLEKGAQGYKKALKWVSGNVKVYFDGNENMGCHVVATGDGCRSLFGHISPKRLCSNVQLEHGRFSRVDLALDDFGCNFYSVSALREELLSGHIISLWRSATTNNEVSISDPGDVSKDILYFGSMQSDTFLRVYDKQKETNMKRADDEKPLETPWVRWEMVFRHERAMAIIQELLNNDFLVGVTFVGVLSYYFRIVQPNGDSNKSRWPLSDLWKKFLDGAEKLRLVVMKMERTIDTIKEWVKRQVVPSLNVIMQAEGDFEWIVQEILKGKWRLKPGHLQLINTYKKEVAVL